MDPVLNPYSPGMGRKPSALVGRDQPIAKWRVSLQRAERGRTDQPYVLYGLRGVGKTVLLAQFRHDAEDRNWIVAQIEASSSQSLRELLGEALYEPLTELNKPSAGQKLLKAIKTALSFKASYDESGTWSFGVDLAGAPGGGADTGVLMTDLKKLVKDLSMAAREEEIGLAILIDEAQDLPAGDLETLAMVAQAAAQDDWPVLIGLAGLPSLLQILSEAKSYTERFQYTPIEKLDDDAARDAFALPAAEEGAVWEEDALSFAVEASGRYPYFIQQFGQDTWNLSEGPRITKSDAKLGVATGQNQLDNGFFRARWDRATAGEKQYLRAMIPGGDDGIATSEVASRLGKGIQSSGPTRAKLISKGLVYAPDHGVIAFTVPGMAAFVNRQVG